MRKTSKAGLFTRSVHLAAIGAQSAKACIPVWIHQIKTCLMMCVRKRRGVAHVSSSGGETGHCPSCIIHACHVRPWGCVSVCEQHETTSTHCISAVLCPEGSELISSCLWSRGLQVRRDSQGLIWVCLWNLVSGNRSTLALIRIDDTWSSAVNIINDLHLCWPTTLFGK